MPPLGSLGDESVIPPLIDALVTRHDIVLPGNDMIANLIFKRVIGTLDWPFGSAISVILLSLLFVIVWTYNRYLGINQIFKNLQGN